MTIDLDELERLMAAATPGEWGVDGARGKFSRINPNGQFHGVGPDGDAVAAVFYDTETGLGFMDAKLIVALHNSAAAMIAEIRELRAENARLREANGILEDGLQEVGDDYPGSSCQEWCQHQIKQARAALGEPQ